jgi:hypothetical protein
MFGPKSADLDVFNLDSPENAPRLREPHVPRGREKEDRGPVLDYDAAEDSDLSLDQELPREEGPRSEGTGEGDGLRPRRRRRGRGRRGRGEQREAAPPRREENVEPAGEDLDLDRDVDLDLDADLLGDRGSAGRDSASERPSRTSRPERPERGARPERPERAERAVRSPRGERPERGERPARGDVTRGETLRGEGARSEASRGEAGRNKERDLYPPSTERDSGDEGDQRVERPRRRRGRGRSERDRDEASKDRPASFGPAAEDEGRYGERPPARPPAARHEEEPDDLDLHAETDDLEEEGAGGLPTHRKIPTWEEAVGILIDANMTSRANSPDRDRGRGGRGRGRGRGR